MQTILVSGGTGMIGKTLVPFLNQSGYKIIILTRDKSKYPASADLSYASWDVEKQEIDISAVQKADYIIHLAGAGVMDKRWTKKYKQEIIDSRVKSCELLVNTLRNNKNEVKAIISASAIGWYGADLQKNKAFTEDDPASKDFLGVACELWEKSILQAETIGIRVCTIRTGIVLDKNGGALAEFIKPVKFGLAAILSTGKQVVSWIHVMDHCRLILQALQQIEMRGAYNSVAPAPVTNKMLVLKAAKILKGRSFIPVHVPAFVLKLMLGEGSEEVLKSTTVSATKIKNAGFVFVYPTLDAALQQLLKS